MCILFIAVKAHPQYPLIVAANRDEFHVRPSQSLRQWPDVDGVIAGRDLQAGGTWLGLHERGRFAALTNIRRPDLIKSDAPSRGALVVAALQASDSQAYGQQLLAGGGHNPYNLVFGDINNLQVFCSVSRELKVLAPGVYAVSNGEPDAQWPKMQRGVQMLQHALATDRLSSTDLQAMMRDKHRAADAQLPDTGVGLAVERMLSPIFIEGDDYGTRTTSLLFLSAQSYRFYEQNYHADGSDAGSSCLQGQFG